MTLFYRKSDRPAKMENNNMKQGWGVRNILPLVLVLAGTAIADCPGSIPCPIDGETMLATNYTVNAAGHKVARFEHKAYVKMTDSGPVYEMHTTFVDCDK